MKKSEQNREKKRTAILDAARRAFFAEGYAGTAMDTVADRAGVTKQTIYRYYPSKEALFRAVLEARPESPSGRFHEELDREDAREALTRFAVGFLELHLSEAHLAGVRLLVAEGPEAPEMARAFYAVGPAETEARLAGFLADRCGVDDPEFAVKMVLGTLLSMRMRVLTGLWPVPAHDEIVRHAERTVDMCMKLFAGKPGKP